MNSGIYIVTLKNDELISVNKGDKRVEETSIKVNKFNCKVGKAKDLEKRKKNYFKTFDEKNVNFKILYELENIDEVEKKILKSLDDYRIRGRSGRKTEWLENILPKDVETILSDVMKDIPQPTSEDNDYNQIFINLCECYVVGLQYYDFEKVDKLNLETVSFVREDNNEYDRNAISVYVENSKIGYIPKEFNQILSTLMDQNVSLVGDVVDYDEDEIITKQLLIKITQQIYKMEVVCGKITKDGIDEILSYLEYFSTDNDLGEWEGGDKNDEDVFIMPHFMESDKLLQFRKSLLNTNFTVIFDWSRWDEGREIISDKSKILQSNLLTLRMLVTAIIRNDRFCEGVFVGSIEDKTISTILQRLKTLRELNELG